MILDSGYLNLMPLNNYEFHEYRGREINPLLKGAKKIFLLFSRFLLRSGYNSAIFNFLFRFFFGFREKRLSKRHTSSAKAEKIFFYVFHIYFRILDKN